MKYTNYLFTGFVIIFILFSIITSLVKQPEKPSISLATTSSTMNISPRQTSVPTDSIAPTSRPANTLAPTRIPTPRNTVAPTVAVTPDPRCIIIVDGQKYDVTAFQNQHSGGNIFNCGTDMSTIFHQQHNQRYLNMMSQYKI